MAVVKKLLSNQSRGGSSQETIVLTNHEAAVVRKLLSNQSQGGSSQETIVLTNHITSYRGGGSQETID